MRRFVEQVRNGPWLAAVLLLTACVGRPLPPTARAEPPSWLDQLPASKENLCAIGLSGPTYYPEDAVANSKAQAFTELARGIQVRVKSDMEIRQRGESSGASEVTVEELSAFMTEVVVKLAQVRSQWVNSGGFPTRGERGTVYTLVCMPLAMSAAEMGQKVQGRLPVANPRLPLLLKHTEAVMKEWTQ